SSTAPSVASVSKSVVGAGSACTSSMAASHRRARAPAQARAWSAVSEKSVAHRNVGRESMPRGRASRGPIRASGLGPQASAGKEQPEARGLKPEARAGRAFRARPAQTRGRMLAAMESKARILVVDDEVNARTALVELLREAGYEADSAADGFKALGKLADFA